MLVKKKTYRRFRVKHRTDMLFLKLGYHRACVIIQDKSKPTLVENEFDKMR